MNLIDNHQDEYKQFINGRDEMYRVVIFGICILMIALIYTITYSLDQKKQREILENKIIRDSLTDISYQNLMP